MDVVSLILVTVAGVGFMGGVAGLVWLILVVTGYPRGPRDPPSRMTTRPQT